MAQLRCEYETSGLSRTDFRRRGLGRCTLGRYGKRMAQANGTPAVRWLEVGPLTDIRGGGAGEKRAWRVLRRLL